MGGDAALILAYLLVGHLVADGVLQPPTLSAAKRADEWRRRWGALALHGSVHGGFVVAATGLWWLGALEVATHVAIDRAKGRGHIGTVADQALHLACKAVWLACALGWV